jgi:uncharacterized protein YcfJ
MYVSSALRRALLLGGVALLAVVAMIALTSRPEPAATPSYAPPTNAYGEPSAAVANTPVVYAVSPFVPSEPASPVPQEITAAAPVTAAAVTASRAVAPKNARRSRRHVVVKKRPLKRSVAIVGGSAAGGALIGGLAGGGKGAGIGALAGGAGGLVYDRLTHKKKVVVRR